MLRLRGRSTRNWRRSIRRHARKGGRFAETRTLSKRTGLLNHNKDDTVDNKCARNHKGTSQVLFHPIVKRNTYHCCRYTGKYDFSPKRETKTALGRTQARAEYVELGEEGDQHGQNGAQLNHHKKHIPKGSCRMQGHKTFEQEHMPG